MSDVQHILCGNAAAAVQPSSFFLMIRPPSRSTLFPYRTIFRYHLMNCIIGFDIIHPICQTSSIFSAEMRPPPCDRAAAVSEDAWDMLQDILVPGLILPNI